MGSTSGGVAVQDDEVGWLVSTAEGVARNAAFETRFAHFGHVDDGFAVVGDPFGHAYSGTFY